MSNATQMSVAKHIFSHSEEQAKNMFHIHILSILCGAFIRGSSIIELVGLS